MKGWVYVTTNDSFPGLVKVGFSSKDPSRRAEQLNATGIPDPHVVQYEVLVENPYPVEQQVHARLNKFHYRKEFFRCDVATAVAAVREVVGDGALYENATAELLEKVELEAWRRRRTPEPLICGRCFKAFAQFVAGACPHCGITRGT